jgi:hypothetical protein
MINGDAAVLATWIASLVYLAWTLLFPEKI